MSWSLPPDDVLNESGHTDDAGDQSNEGDGGGGGGGIFNASEYGLNVHAPDYHSLQDTNTAFGEINESYYTDRASSSPAHSPSKHEFESPTQPYRKFNTPRIEKVEGHYQPAWAGAEYKVESPSMKENWMSRDDSSSSYFEGTSRTEEKSWPSLQIVCPEPPAYNPQSDYQPLDSSRGAQYPYMYPPAGSPSRGARSAVLGAPSSARPVSYYQQPSPGIMEDSPLSYHKMGGYPYSPAMRHAGGGGGGGGYRSSMYGMPLTPRGPMSMMSPHRAPAINRRFMEPIDGYIYQVQFKRAHKNFILAPSAPRNIIPGDFVKVEADRGEDMGIVLSKSPASDFEEVMPTAGYRGRGFSSGQGERKFLFRLANAEERAALVNKVQDEERALEVIRSKVMEQMLPMTILDAEYQFDRHKLTYYFEADRRIDFRELVSELFSLYKTRIWMQQVDTSVLGMNDAGLELAKATGFLPERDDHAYLATSHMHRTEGIHGIHSHGGHGGGYGGHGDARALQYPPQLSQHQPQHLRAPAPGPRAEATYQSPLYGGATSTWAPPPQPQQQQQPPSMRPQSFGAGPSAGFGPGGGQQGRAEQADRYMMPTRDPLAASGSFNTGFAYGTGGLLDAPLAPLAQAPPPVMRPSRLPMAPQPIQLGAALPPYQPLQPSAGLYGADPATASPQPPVIESQQSFFGSYAPLPAAPQQDDFYASYFQPKGAQAAQYGGSGQSASYYEPQQGGEQAGDQGGEQGRVQLAQQEQGYSVSPHTTGGAKSASSDAQDGEEGDGEGGAGGDSASLNTFIETWSLRDPR